VSEKLALALPLALLSTTLVNLAYLREHDAASSLPTLSLHRPVHSLTLLLGDRSWLVGFAMEGGGFVLYAIALALAPLALVQSVAAGGIGLLAFLTVRLGGGRLGRRRLFGVVVATLGLVALGVSLAEGAPEGHSGSTLGVLAWLGGSAALAVTVLLLGRRLLGVAVSYAIAGGLFFSIGDISTKLATQGGVRIAFAVTLIAGYVLGSSLMQVGYQAGSALTVAGLATLLTNVMPILAATFVLEEPVPTGALGALRVLAFVAVTVGAVVLATPGTKPAGAPAPGIAPSGAGSAPSGASTAPSGASTDA
jgi:drug/metabolite transporter (DMT)-like permease